jgi:hypothetical protein
VIEVPLHTAADRHDLLVLMRQLAAANGMHVDDGTSSSAEFQRSRPKDMVDTRATIYAGMWRGSSDGDIELIVSDMFHLRRAWVSFLRGGGADLPAARRREAMAGIRRRWPDARSVPVLPSGGEPLAEDLRPTPQGYRIASSAAARYGLASTSALVVPD